MALAEAAGPLVDAVVCVLPREFPHEKAYREICLEDRVRLLLEASRHPVAVTEGGLFIEMAREFRRELGEIEIDFLCGRDAAERIVGWDYGEPRAIERLLDEFRLLVAARDGHYAPPPHLAGRITALDPGDWSEVSSTEVRRRIAGGEPWEHLVPEGSAGLIRSLYENA